MSVQEIDVGGIGRRSFVGYVLAGTTLVAAADLALGGPARAAAPSGPQVAELYDLNDFITDSCRPTANLITIDGPQRRHGALRAAAVGERPGDHDLDGDDHRRGAGPPGRQGRWSRWPTLGPSCSSTSSPAGSTTTTSTYTPIRVAAAVARGALLEAAAIVLGDERDNLVAKGGVIQNRAGDSVTYGELAEAAAAKQTRRSEVTLKEVAQFRVIGTGQGRTDARDAVTGQEDLHDRPQGQGGAADHGLPRPHAQRHPEAAAQQGRDPRDARRQGRRGRRHRRGGAGQDVRSVHRRHPGDEGRVGRRAGRRASPTRTSCAS